MIFTMKVPLTFKIGDNMNNFFFIISFFFLTCLTEWKPLYDETTITLAASHY